MKHGPIALIDENMPVIFLAPPKGHYEKVVSNAQEIKARKGKIIATKVFNNEKRTLTEFKKASYVTTEETVLQ